jgi:hypothetical protein
VRDVYKTVVVATMYGQSAKSLARRPDMQTCYAARLLTERRKLYPRYWAWSNNVSATFQRRGVLDASLGWQLHRSEWSDNDLSVRNWPLQTAGSEILRVAVVRGAKDDEGGVRRVLHSSPISGIGRTEPRSKCGLRRPLVTSAGRARG